MYRWKRSKKTNLVLFDWFYCAGLRMVATQFHEQDFGQKLGSAESACQLKRQQACRPEQIYESDCLDGFVPP